MPSPKKTDAKAKPVNTTVTRSRRRVKSDMKRGILSNEDKRQIEKWMEMKSDEEIGKMLRRPAAVVTKYRLQYFLDNPEVQKRQDDHSDLRKMLHNHYEWDYYKKEYKDDELILFEHDFVQLMSQFKSDVLPTELKQVFNAINLNILIHRHNRDRMMTERHVDRLEHDLEEERAKFPSRSLMTPEDKRRLNDMENSVAGIRMSFQGRTKELKELQDRYSATIKELKGTREQRIQKIEDSKVSFVGLMRQLEEEEYRNRLGQDMSIMEAAVNQERRRLSEYHEYMDGSIDSPLLTPETLKEKDDAESPAMENASLPT